MMLHELKYIKEIIRDIKLSSLLNEIHPYEKLIDRIFKDINWVDYNKDSSKIKHIYYNAFGEWVFFSLDDNSIIYNKDYWNEFFYNFNLNHTTTSYIIKYFLELKLNIKNVSDINKLNNDDYRQNMKLWEIKTFLMRYLKLKYNIRYDNDLYKVF